MDTDKSITWDEFCDFCKSLYNVIDGAIDEACNNSTDENIAYSYTRDYAHELLNNLGITNVMRPFTIYSDSTIDALTE